MTNVFNALKKRDKHDNYLRVVRQMSQCLCVLAMSVFFIANVRADEDKAKKPDSAEKKISVAEMLAELKSTFKTRGYNWDSSVFSEDGLQVGGYSTMGRPLVYYTCGDREAGNSSLILSAVHGDEVNPAYFGFRLVEWMRARPQLCKDGFVVIAPMVNPDGVVRYTKGTRTNYNKIDLNRNFDTPDWSALALKLWRERYRSRRYYPGERPASEAETQFQKWLIDEFKPNKILSIHAPLNILDYDGPKDADTELFSKNYVDSCELLKTAMQKATPSLKFFAYGVFPGSLGNYAGKQRGIPTFTVELPTTDPKLAGHYFGELETGTKLFITHSVAQKQAANP